MTCTEMTDFFYLWRIVMKKALGAAIVLLALVIAIVPLFTDCLSQGRSLTTKDGKSVPMKCHWTAIAEIGIAVPLALTGLFNLRKQRKDSARPIAIIGIASGALAILYPTVLIGVCANPDMICNMVMRPILITAGTLAIAASIIQFVSARDPELHTSGLAS
jgi:hypothetical protein